MATLGRNGKPRNFVAWLRGRGPQLASLKVTVRADDSEKTVSLHKGGKGAQSCAFTAKTVLALEPSKAEALDAEGSILGIFEFPDPEGDELEAPGYTHDPEDTNEERLLKTFAHLLADAHRTAINATASVVKIQAEHFAEERKGLQSSLYTLERMMQRSIRGNRVRVASASDVEDDEPEDDSAFQGMLQQVLQGMAKKAVTQVIDAPASEGPVNGKSNA
jgi:hypothetical protein